MAIHFQKVDSRLGLWIATLCYRKARNDIKAEKLGESQAAGFVDDFWGFQAVGAGIYLVGNEQAHRAESPKSAAKPTPTSL